MESLCGAGEDRNDNNMTTKTKKNKRDATVNKRKGSSFCLPFSCFVLFFSWPSGETSRQRPPRSAATYFVCVVCVYRPSEDVGDFVAERRWRRPDVPLVLLSAAVALGFFEDEHDDVVFVGAPPPPPSSCFSTISRCVASRGGKTAITEFPVFFVAHGLEVRPIL